MGVKEIVRVLNDYLWRHERLERRQDREADDIRRTKERQAETAARLAALRAEACVMDQRDRPG